MDTIKIRVSIPAAVALREGTGRAGEATVALGADILSALSDDDRALLARIFKPGERPDSGGSMPREIGGYAFALAMATSDTSQASVIEAMRGSLADYRASLASLVAAIEANPDKYLCASHNGDVNLCGDATTFAREYPNHPAVQSLRARAAEQQRALRDELAVAAVAAGPEKIVERYSGNGDWDIIQRIPAWWKERDDTRALIAAAKAIAAAWNVKDKKRAAEAEARKAAEAAAAEARKAAVHAALRAYALTVDDLAPAAEDGYDIVPGALNHIAELVAEAALASGATSADIVRDGTAAWDAWDMDERAAPKADAVRAARAFREACSKITVPEGVAISVEKVQRVTRTRETTYAEAEKTRTTSLVAFVDCEVGKRRAVLASLE